MSSEKGVDLLFSSGEKVFLPPGIFDKTNYGTLYEYVKLLEQEGEDVYEIPAPNGLAPSSAKILVEYYTRFGNTQDRFTAEEIAFVEPHAEELLLVANALGTERLYFLARDTLAKCIPQMPTELIIQWMNIQPPDFLQQL